jgi:hypothetical protein
MTIPQQYYSKIMWCARFKELRFKTLARRLLIDLYHAYHRWHFPVEIIDAYTHKIMHDFNRRRTSACHLRATLPTIIWQFIHEIT